jgi:hypothetical protein
MALPLLSLLLLAQPNPVVDLPFEAFGGKPYIKGIANGKPISIIVDTGASTSIVDLELAEQFGAPSVHEIKVGGVGSNTSKGLMLRDFEVRLVGSSLTHEVSIAVPLDAVGAMAGRRLEMVLGYDFLKNYVVQFDYAQRRLRLYEPARFKPSSAPIPMQLVSNHPVITGKVEIPHVGVETASMMIDTGASTAFSFTSKFSTAKGLFGLFSSLPTVPTGGGVGGMSKGKRIRIPSAQLGSAKLLKPVVNLPQSGGGVLGDDAEFDVLLGSECLRRFTLTVDYPNSKVYLEPNNMFAQAFVGDKSGLHVMAEGKDLKSVWVYETLAGSPSAKAGFMKGDRILKVDGKPAGGLGVEGLKNYIKSGSKAISFLVKRGGKQLTLTFVPKELL